MSKLIEHIRAVQSGAAPVPPIAKLSGTLMVLRGEAAKGRELTKK